ncbi:MAG TPA: FKBP-type peptidyl-prolyl cis-trans isomerase [Candidatus Avimuribaculum pullicola]|nr:FKBP-type peptidyl-prolyl cis-trans isomerase [Candidatus Avimuribaculum pullicola]
MDKLSYALGISMGNNFMRSGIEKLDYSDFAAGVKAAYESDYSQMTTDTAKRVVNEFFAMMEERIKDVNKKAGEQYLAENAKRPEVRTTASGLQYEIIKEGEGASPKPNDAVTVHYTGALIDGRVFDSSVERGEPATFGVTQVIPGWVEALQMMKPGAEWRIFVPSNLAYGPQGAGGIIGPNMTLIFDIKLIKVN